MLKERSRRQRGGAVGGSATSRMRAALTLAAAVVVAVGTLVSIEDPLRARGLLVAGLYLTLALSEIVAPFVPTLFLLVATPLVLGPMSNRYALGSVLGWAADPVLALFAGGLTLGLAAQRHGVDRALAALVLQAAGKTRRGLLAIVLLSAAGLSMWLSNVAAAVLLLAALRPALATSIDPTFRRSLLVALAAGANLGGMTTPIGSGPNAIAIAEIRRFHSIEFLEWMGFGVPLACGLCAMAYGWLVVRYRVSGPSEIRIAAPPPLTGRGLAVVASLACAIVAWLTERWHGVPAPAVALGLMLVLFGSQLLTKSDLGSLDWSTLGLIAGGLTLGRLLETADVLSPLTHTLSVADYPRWMWLGALVLASAGLSAIMSNTATAAMLVPLGLQIDASASTAISIAIATGFGMPFPISTPPNALVYGTGELRPRDLLELGLALTVIGCAIVTFSGSWFLKLFALG